MSTTTSKATKAADAPSAEHRSAPKAAPGTTKRLFAYIFAYTWRVTAIIVCILLSAAAQAGSALFLQTLIDTYILPLVGVANPDWMPLIEALILMGCL
ncbi:MAG: ABC transporter ATP-binding protein, partial [Bifidobacterium crudilactis]|nr:ABC transporter ATP-binding protein [Bifidobacterium crudilactis]